MKQGKIVGVLGSGLVGRDPFDERSWSGSSRFFFNTCLRFGILERAFGVEVPELRRYFMLLKAFAFNREVWRQKFYFDTSYYDELTKEIARKLLPGDFNHSILQIGGIYNVPGIVKGRCKCFSYHDGNIAQLVKSPYFPRGIAKATIEKAFEYERKVYSRMDKILTMSEYLRRSFVDEFGIEESKVVCIGAGMNLENIPPETEKDYSKQKVLFVGIRFNRKGGREVLKAFRIVKSKQPRAELHIIGPPELSIPQELSKGVTHHGFLNRNDHAQRRRFDDILRSACLFVMPSLYEPFGIAPLEAMVNQVPCILTDNWAFPEMIQPGMNGELVECGNVELLAEKMLRLLSDPELLAEMGREAREKVLGKYTWDIVVTRLCEEIN